MLRYSRTFTDCDRHITSIHRTSIGTVLAAQDVLTKDIHRMALNTEEYLNRHTTYGGIEGVLHNSSLSITAKSSAQEQRSLESVDAKREELVPFLQRTRANRSFKQASSRGSSGFMKQSGISGSFVWYWDQHQSTYTVALRPNLPALLGQRALSFELTVRQYALSWTNLSFLYGSIGVSMVVPCTSKIFQACEQGDELTVRELLESRQAGPNDWCGKCYCSSRNHGCHDEDEIPLFVSALFD